MFLGDEQFVQKMMNRLTQAQNNKPTAQWQEVPAQQRKAVKMSLECYAAQYSEDRNSAIKASFQAGQHSMKDIAQHFGLHYTSVSRIVKEV